MSEIECELCVWLAGLPTAMQILLGAAFLVLVAPALLWALAASTPRIDETLERYITDAPSRQEQTEHRTGEDSHAKPVDFPDRAAPKLFVVPRAGLDVRDTEP